MVRSLSFVNIVLMKSNMEVLLLVDVEDGDLSIHLEVELECETPISLGHEDVVLDPIQVSEVQHYRSVPKLDVRSPVRDGFENMVADRYMEC